MSPTATWAVTGVTALRLHGPSGNDYRAERNAKVNVMLYADGSVNLRPFKVGMEPICWSRSRAR